MADEKIASSYEVIGATLADIDPELDAFTDAVIDTVEASYLGADNYLMIHLKLACEHTTGEYHEFRLKMKEFCTPQDATGIANLKTRIKEITGDFITGVTNTIAEGNYASISKVIGKGRITYWYNLA